MGEKYDALMQHLREVQNLSDAISLLNWDRETTMPPAGAAARARQMATLARLRHEMLTSDRTLRLLDAAEAEIGTADYASDEASMIRIVREDYEQATRLPNTFVASYTQQLALAHKAWVEARAKADFRLFEDALRRNLELYHQEAEYLGWTDHPYDALINKNERGLTTAKVNALFAAHRDQLIELVRAIAAAPEIDDSFLHRTFDIETQRRFLRGLVEALGFDFQRGVQAVAVHPFASKSSKNDVRITTRYSENFLNRALFAMIHEAGHGMYEQGIGENIEGTPLARGIQGSVHESQSRMWENIVGRSRAFWQWALPRLQSAFPQLEGITLDQFYRAINKTQRSFIRVEADEVAYNLHIILRFEMEKDILTGQLAVRDLPDAWNARFHELFGMTPPDDALGVLQDVHWSSGYFGYFPTYALGNLLTVQYYEKALGDHPTLPDEIAQGKFDTLLNWLNANIHRHGRRFTSSELTQRITGEDMNPAPYVRYLREKYSAVYAL